MSEVEAAKAIEAYFEGFNTNNQEIYLNSLHFPHVRINNKGRVLIVQNASELLPLKDLLTTLTKIEGWHHSTLDSIELVHASEIKVHFKIEFSRYKADGSKYAVYKSLWIITKKDDHWGVQARSSYAP
jgi:hypothetical protein